METFNIVELTEAEIPELVHLSALLGWDYAPPELRTILTAGIAYGHRNEAGELISSAAIIPYGDTLASIGMVMVHPEYRRLGLGKEATQRVIDCLPEGTPIMLVATDGGKLLYETMGFQTVETLHKFIANQYDSPADGMLADGYEIVPMEEVHLEDVIRLDAAAVGGDRTHFLQLRIEQSAEGVVVKGTDGSIMGFGLSIQGPANRIIGPIVAPDTQSATALIDRLCRVHEGELRIDVPSHQEALLSTLTAAGFECVRVPPVMLLNRDRLPRRNDSLYGIAAQVFG